jgi:hypothetical protein
MKRPIVLCGALAVLACGQSPPAEDSGTVSADTAAAVVADTGVADSVMARDTARQLP